jgi:hypothetical protein
MKPGDRVQYRYAHRMTGTVVKPMKRGMGDWYVRWEQDPFAPRLMAAYEQNLELISDSLAGPASESPAEALALREPQKRRPGGTMKTEAEVRKQLAEMLALDARSREHNPHRASMDSKAAACKTLLWVLGENDDDRWFIRATPGPAVDARGKDRN